MWNYRQPIPTLAFSPYDTLAEEFSNWLRNIVSHRNILNLAFYSVVFLNVIKFGSNLEFGSLNDQAPLKFTITHFEHNRYIEYDVTNPIFTNYFIIQLKINTNPVLKSQSHVNYSEKESQEKTTIDDVNNRFRLVQPERKKYNKNS